MREIEFMKICAAVHCKIAQKFDCFALPVSERNIDIQYIIHSTQISGGAFDFLCDSVHCVEIGAST